MSSWNFILSWIAHDILSWTSPLQIISGSVHDLPRWTFRSAFQNYWTFYVWKSANQPILTILTGDDLIVFFKSMTQGVFFYIVNLPESVLLKIDIHIRWKWKLIEYTMPFWYTNQNKLFYRKRNGHRYVQDPLLSIYKHLKRATIQMVFRWLAGYLLTVNSIWAHFSLPTHF